MRIAIDSGHGPETSGKRTPDGSMREFQFNYATGRYLREQLLKYANVETIFVFDPSEDTPLRERTNQANSASADLYVSIHANAYGSDWNNANGIETFVYTKASDASRNVARLVQSRLIALTGRANRGVKTANFHVLRETTMPAILVECGFMTNREEAELLKDDAYRRLCAQAIAEGIAQAYGLTEAAGTTGGSGAGSSPGGTASAGTGAGTAGGSSSAGSNSGSAGGSSGTGSASGTSGSNTGSSSSTGSTSTSGLTDIQGHWAEQAIRQVYASGAMVGYPDGTFRPDEPITRAELAALLVKLRLLDS